MEIFSLIILTLSCIGCVYLTHRFAAPINLKLNFASWNILVEFILTGVIGVYTIESVNLETNWIFRNIPIDQFPKQEVIWTLIWCCLGMPLGFYLANKLLTKLKLNDSYNKFINDSFKHSFSVYMEYALIFLICSYTGFVIYKIGYIPQFKAIGMDIPQLITLRGKLTHTFPTSIHLKELIGLRLTPILSYYFYAKLIDSKNKKYIIHFLLLMFISFFFSTINVNKSGIALYLIGLFITHCIVSKNFNTKKSLLVLFSIFVFTTLSFAIIKNNYNFVNMVKQVHKRVVYAQSYANYYSFYLFPDKLDHIGFKSLTKMRTKIGLDYKLPASRQMMREALPQAFKDNRAGYLTSHYFAEAWANFGLIGIILSPIVVGFLIKFIIGLLISFPKSYISVAIIGYASFNFRIFSELNSLLFPRYLIIYCIFFLSIYKLDNLLKRKFYS